MGKVGCAVKLPEPVIMNVKRDVVFTLEEAYGLPVHHDLIYDDYTLFVDKVGTNTNLKDDSRVGGEKTIVGNKGAAKETVAINNLHCTTLGLPPQQVCPSCALVFFP